MSFVLSTILTLANFQKSKEFAIKPIMKINGKNSPIAVLSPTMELMDRKRSKYMVTAATPTRVIRIINGLRLLN